MAGLMSTRRVDPEQQSNSDNVAIVKKYANRRLYNTKTRSYLTLDELRQLVQRAASMFRPPFGTEEANATAPEVAPPKPEANLSGQVRDLETRVEQLQRQLEQISRTGQPPRGT